MPAPIRLVSGSVGQHAPVVAADVMVGQGPLAVCGVVIEHPLHIGMGSVVVQMPAVVSHPRLRICPEEVT